MQPQRRHLGLAPWQWVALLGSCFVVLILTLNPRGAGEAHAYSINGDDELIINASRVEVRLVCVDASYNNHFGLHSVEDGRIVDQYIFYCKDAPPGAVYVGTFGPGELEFMLTTPQWVPQISGYPTYFTGPKERNPDNFVHAHIVRIDDQTAQIRWEDLWGGGDQDFNDCVVNVIITELATPTPTRTPTPTNTPVPPTNTPTATSTPVPPTNTPTPTYTPVPPTNTPTPTYTPVPPTNTPTPTYTPVPPSNTPTPTYTPVPPSNTPTPTYTPEATPTNTNTPVVPTPTNTPVAPTATATPPLGPPENRMVMDPSSANLWLCIDQAHDGIDNDGDSVVDNEPATCTGTGEGKLAINELVFSSRDCDSPNDDDDHDGKPVSNDPNSPGYRPECPKPTADDYANGLVDKNGGELPEGLGALEFQLKFDHKLFNINIVDSGDWVAPGGYLNCTMTILTENDIRYGCVTTWASGYLGYPQVSGKLAATINLTPASDLIYRIRPTKDNGVVARLLDENCEIADTLGDVFPNTLAGGLTKDCSGLDVTVRRLEGDVDSNCKVDVVDAQRDAWRYGSFFGHLSYDQNYDLQPWPTGDFDIDIKDLQFVFGRIGSTCQNPIPDQNPMDAGGLGQP